VNVGILTISDRAYAGTYEDRSGQVLEELILNQPGWLIAVRAVIPDEQVQIEKTLIEWADQREVSFVITTGGTGFGPRDVTPEATKAVIDRDAPGLSEAIRARGLATTPHAMLSRGASGIRGRTLIVNLSGSPRAVREQFEVIAPVILHAVDLLTGNPGAESGHVPLQQA
jgi:molybdenum cofactor synthesis domain-containing protein